MLMKTLNERRVLSTIHLSDMQSVVLAKIIAAATPQTAFEAINNGRNLVGARDELQRLGLIAVLDGTVSVTNKGQQIMQAENLVSDTGELTDRGIKFAQVQELADLKDIDNPQAAEEQPTSPPGTEQPQGPEEAQPAAGPMESFSLIRSMNEILNQKKIIEELNNRT